MRIMIYISAVIAAAAILGGALLRKELPYQFDVVQLADKIAVINHDTWNQRVLKVSIDHDGALVASGEIDPKDHSEVFENIPGSGQIDVEISRNDLLGKLRYRSKTMTLVRSDADQRYIVLVGASIGRSWNLGDFNRRINDHNIIFSSRAHYDFDKTDTLMPLLNLKVKPDAIIIKECADYFPRRHDESAAKLRRWVNQVKDSGIQPILATTVPVTQNGPKKESQESIIQWNAFVRGLAASHQIPLLDLAVALQVSEANPHLKEEYAREDGYHLTAGAYRHVLDPLLKNFSKATVAKAN